MPLRVVSGVAGLIRTASQPDESDFIYFCFLKTTRNYPHYPQGHCRFKKRDLQVT
jgi:hypothetical protein